MSTDLDPAVELVARAIREATDTELDNCLEDQDECFERKIHLGSEIEGVVRTVYATPEQIGRASVAALRRSGFALPPVVQTREEWRVVYDDRGTLVEWLPPGTSEARAKQSLANCLRTWPSAELHVRTITTHADDGSEHGGATVVGRWRTLTEEPE